jgi:hypothetical protein
MSAADDAATTTTKAGVETSAHKSNVRAQSAQVGVSAFITEAEFSAMSAAQQSAAQVVISEAFAALSRIRGDQ